MGQKLNDREMRLYRAVDEVLFCIWDPIGVAPLLHARDEYQGYLPSIFALVRDGEEAAVIARRLGEFAAGRMGLTPSPRRDLRAAEVMIAWMRTIGDFALPQTWSYHGMPGDRMELLQSTEPIESLVAAIVEGSEVNDLRTNELCTGERDGRGSHRVAFSLRPVTESAERAIDILLNGTRGIRCRYAVDPGLGASATTAVCGGIACAIVQKRVRIGADHIYRAEDLGIRLLPSLVSPSAKVWFDQEIDRRGAASLLEQGRIECSSWQPAEAEYGRLSEELFLGEQQVRDIARKGSAAPKPRALDAKGAWVRPDGREFVVPHKLTRALQIHHLGWT